MLRLYEEQIADQRIHTHPRHTLENIPVSSPDPAKARQDAVLLRDVATIENQRHPAEADHYNIQPEVDVLVSPRTVDLGDTQEAIQKSARRRTLSQ